MKYPFEQDWVTTVQPPEPDQVTVDQLVQRVIGVGFPTLNDSMLVTADGTNTARPIYKRAADELIVFDFVTSQAAVEAGTEDIGPAINAALSEAASYPSPRRIIVPKGRYRLATKIDLLTGCWLEGRGATLVPDKTPDTYVMRAVGTSGTHLTNLTVTGFHIDGTNKPVYPADGTFPDGLTGGWGQIRFDYCDDITVSNITWDNVHSCLVFQNSTGMAVNNLVGHDLTDGVCTFFTGCARGVISNIQATNASECMDFFNTEDITVTNVQATGQFTAGHLNETFDISTSRRISISNVVSKGFSRGALVKSEGTGDGVSVAWSDISLSNCQFHDFATYGINIQSSAAAYNGGTHRIRLANCTFKSSETGAIGIASTPDATYGGNDCMIVDCTVDTPGTGIQASGWTGLLVKGNRVNTAGGRAIDITSTSTHGARVEGNWCYASGGTSADGSIFVQRSDDVRITDNVAYSAAGYGIRFTTGTAGGKRPLISRNLVTGAGLYGIYVQWANAAQFDALRAGEISLNDVRDWGLTTSGRAGIFVTFSSITATVEGLNIVGNTMTLPTAAANSQSGIGVAQTSGAVTFSRCRIDGNTVGSTIPTTVYSLQGTWTQYNTFARNQPPLADLNQVSADRGIVGLTLTVRSDEQIQRFTSSLTAALAVTLSTTGAVEGDWFRIVRTGGDTGGPWNLNVGTGPLKALVVNTWCEVHYTGSAWILTAYGAL